MNAQEYLEHWKQGENTMNTCEGCIWHDDDAALFGGRWEHPTEALTLYPV